jgi:hypothetical protein
MESEHIQRIKNSKRGHLSTVTSRKNEITDLISDDSNLKLVKEKLQSLKADFQSSHEAPRSSLRVMHEHSHPITMLNS